MNALWDPKQKAAVLFRLLLISFLLWTSIHQFVYSRPGLGSTVAGVVFTVSILLMTHNSHHSFSGRFVFLYAISFLFLLGTVINSEPLVQQSSLFLSFCFLLYTVYAERCGIFIFSHNDLMVPDLIRCFLYGLDPDELDSLMPSMKGHKGIRPFVPVMLKGFLGLAIGAPVLFLVTALLSYDDTFTDLLDKILTLEFIDLDFYNIYREGACILCALFIALYVLLLVSSFNRQYAGTGYHHEAWQAAAAKLSFVPAATVFCAVMPLIALYAIFFASQWQYYTSAFTGVLPEGLTYAQYARDGFFQLCTVAFVNLAVLLGCSWFMVKKNGKDTSRKILTVLLTVCTLILIATAMSKMVLYVREYGLTPLRIYASWAMIVLTCVFLLFLAKQFIPKLPLYSICLILCSVLLLALILSDPNRLAAVYNADGFISGKLRTADVQLLSELGNAGVPSLVRLRNYYYGLSDNAQTLLRTERGFDPEFLEICLRESSESLAQDSGLKAWLTGNLSSLLAHKALH